ncbi:hypothetical protein ACFXHA_38510 [Nocardia sp. NPDC059240]|uniref:hypothetical protein n=1 Tax=Nocardia sp. NPDC059240 TaxID=3346786 RepID=UPI00368E6FE6
MLRLIFLVPLACWSLAARPSRHRTRITLILAAIIVVELVVSFEAWSLRSCRNSLEVLLSVLGAVALMIGVSIEKRMGSGPTGRTIVGTVLAGLYCCVLVLGTLGLTALDSGVLDGPGGNGGKQPPIPPADQLGILPAGLKILDKSAGRRLQPCVIAPEPLPNALHCR